MICAKMLNQSEARLNCFLQLPMGTAFTLDVYLPVFCCCWWSFDGVFRWQCDQIGQFIGLWATFQSLWQQLVCPNLPHSQAIFVKVSKSLIFLVKSFLGNFYRHLVSFYWSHWSVGSLKCFTSSFDDGTILLRHDSQGRALTRERERMHANKDRGSSIMEDFVYGK